MIIRPPAAVNAGAGWRLPGETNYHSGTAPVSVAPGIYFLEFKSLDRFAPPARQPLVVRSGQRTPVAASYGAPPGRLPLAMPDLRLSTDGLISTVVRQSNGDLLVGGQFLSINGAPRRNLARIHSDGTVDLTWAPDPDDTVSALLVSGSRVYAAGTFWRIGAAVRPALALLELTGTGAAVAAFNAQVYPITKDAAIGYPNRASVYEMVLNSRGLYVHGDFNALGGLGGFRIFSQPVAKLDPATGHLDANWTVHYRGSSRQLFTDRLAGAGDLLFAQRDQQLQRISPVTGLLFPGWQAVPVDGPEFGVDADALYLQQPEGLRRYPPALNGAADPDWRPDFGGADFFRVPVAAGGYVFVISSVARADGHGYDSVVRRVRTSDGVADRDWQASTTPEFPFTTYFNVFYTPEGLVAASASADSNDNSRLARFDLTSGARQSGFAADVQGDVTNVANFALTPAGEFLLCNPAPEFSRSPAVGALHGDRQALSVLPRFHADGTLDTAWNPQIDGRVLQIVLDGGYAYIAGDFTHVGNLVREGLARLSLAGGGEADASWDPLAAPALKLYAPNVLLVDGGFAYFYAGSPTMSGYYRASTAAGAALDLTWSSGLQAYTRYTLTSDLAGNGWIYLAGDFSGTNAQGGAIRASYVRLDTVHGGLDPQWHAPVVEGANLLATDGQYLYFTFSTRAGTADQIGRLALATGAVDPRWRAVADDYIRTLAVSGGALYAGGYFTAIGGVTATGVARLPLANAGHADRSFRVPLTGQRSLLRNFSSVDKLLPVGQTLFLSGFFREVSGRSLVDFAALPLP